MLTYSMQDAGSESLYLYIYRCIKNDILSGALVSGTRLPSKRSFAKQLGVSNITVENAYAILQSEGYIYSLPKRGFYVSDITFPSFSRADSNTSGIAKNHWEDYFPQPQISYFADFVSNRTVPDNFPFSIWARLMRETISAKSNELMNTPPCGGIPELRLAICSHLKQFRNMDVRPEQVIVGAGTDYLYSMLIQLFGRDKAYAIEDPGYEKIAKVYRSNGVACRYIGMDSSGIRISDLEHQNADIVHISPAHHYPTGIVMPVSRRYELLRWASQTPDRYIIEDDYDSEFRFSGKPIPTLQSIDTLGKVIYMNSFTKSLASTIRISYLVLPDALLRHYYDTLSFYSSTVSNFEQYTLAAFLEEGYFEKHINRMRNHYRAVRDALLKEIAASTLADCTTITEEEAGLHFLLHIRTEMSDDALVRKAAENGIHIACLSEYYHTGTPDKHAIVMNYSGIALAAIPEAIRRLSAALD